MFFVLKNNLNTLWFHKLYFAVFIKEDTLLKKIVLNAASCYNKKYYLNPNMEKLPEQIKKEIKIITSSMAEKLHCIFIIGFYENGSIYIETSRAENDFDFDEIGAELEAKKIKSEKHELLEALQLWFKVYAGEL